MLLIWCKQVENSAIFVKNNKNRLAFINFYGSPQKTPTNTITLHNYYNTVGYAFSKFASHKLPLDYWSE